MYQAEVCGRQVVELGSGCGYVSLCAVLLGVAQVLATDTEEAISLLGVCCMLVQVWSRVTSRLMWRRCTALRVLLKNYVLRPCNDQTSRSSDEIALILSRCLLPFLNLCVLCTKMVLQSRFSQLRAYGTTFIS